jgi:DCC-interacting protein 13 alpha
MATTKKLDLTDALEDRPETRKALEALQQEATSMKSYASALVASFQAVVEAQNGMCRSTDTLTQHLDRYKEQNFAVKQDFISETVRKLGESVQQLKSWQEMLAVQMDQAMVQPMTDFIATDLMEVNRQRELFELASQEHDSAMVKYSKTSKRRETDKARFEANAELYMARKKFHEVTLQYFSAMNTLEQKKKLAILNPLMNFMHAQLSYFKMGHEILTDEMSRFLTTVTIEVNKLQGDYNSEVKSLAARRDKLEKEYATRYNPDPDPTGTCYFSTYC